MNLQVTFLLRAVEKAPPPPPCCAGSGVVLALGFGYGFKSVKIRFMETFSRKMFAQNTSTVIGIWIG
jgi:hypothetical protein